MANGGNGLTKGENLKHADLNTVYHWVLNAWNDISHDIIIQAFKKCSISNCLSGSEDHLIYEDDNKNSDNADEHERSLDLKTSKTKPSNISALRNCRKTDCILNKAKIIINNNVVIFNNTINTIFLSFEIP
ncbi:2112_t:CDS:2 [Cetraspora pellucida]|uniref:2112_t:CDS:1 n=1 Tax=Cetraspora pellucida TaxID=1433469 RepID=A0A9N9HVL2_9GLOM|nr:2112_t:CDS:2 [Cetraspora pellucida]